jgi:hypothetical protein
MSTNTNDPLQDHVFLPHERSTVQRTLARHEAHPNNALVHRLQQNYGPDGVVLFAAGRAGQGFGSAIGVSGGLVLIASRAQGAGAVVGYALLALGIAFAALGFYRYIQAGLAGKRFRNGRQFLRRP